MKTLTIHPSKSRLLLFFVIAIVFICVSLGLIFLPPLKKSIIPLNHLLQPIVGIIGLLFGLIGFGAIFIQMRHPVVQLDEQGIHYLRNQVHIPWANVKKVELVHEWDKQKVRWIYVFVHDPTELARIGKLDKKYGLTKADVTMDFSLATRADFEKANAFIQKRIRKEDKGNV